MIEAGRKATVCSISMISCRPFGVAGETERLPTDGLSTASIRARSADPGGLSNRKYHYLADHELFRATLRRVQDGPHGNER
jgi:hypothetical protein